MEEHKKRNPCREERKTDVNEGENPMNTSGGIKEAEIQGLGSSLAPGLKPQVKKVACSVEVKRPKMGAHKAHVYQLAQRGTKISLFPF